MTNIEEYICPNCHMALLYPMEDEKLASIGWFRCTSCAYCKVIESQSYKNQTKNQK